MKTGAKIIAYSIWFGLTLWLYIYWGWIISKPLDFFEEKIIRTQIPPNVGFVMEMILLIGFLGCLAWLPIWFMKKWSAETSRTTGRDITFMILLLGCATLSAVAWQFYFPENIYNCTDDNEAGFLRPGNWIHGNYATVPKVVPSLSMSEPDTIKEGWTVFKLWWVWWLFIFASVALSAAFTSLIFRRRKIISS